MDKLRQSPIRRHCNNAATRPLRAPVPHLGIVPGADDREFWTIRSDDSALDNALYSCQYSQTSPDFSFQSIEPRKQSLGQEINRNHTYLPLLDLSCADFPPDQRAPSLSPPSSVSQISSAGSALSTVVTDQSEKPTALTSWSRGPSPLSVVDNAEAERGTNSFICLGPQCTEAFVTEEELSAHFKAAHRHTCNWAGCAQPSFETRDGLIWHVNAEHLLVCPAPGCTEKSFPTRKLLACHMKVAHQEVVDKGKSPAVRADIVGEAVTTSQPESRGGHRGPPPNGRSDILEDKALREILSVAVSKKRCRDQLRAVVEKKARRAAYGTPRNIESPTDLVRSRSPRLIESASFPVVWEHGVLPFLIEFIPKWCGPGHVISVTRGKTPNSRRICIMTRKKVSRARRMIIASHVRDLLPDSYKHGSLFHFSTGEVNRLVWARGLSRDFPDEICAPRNPFHFRNPCMGDSIGVSGDEDISDATATLGPCLIVGGGSFWLASFHPFVDLSQSTENVTVEHPSPGDRLKCSEKAHDALSEEDDFALGMLTASSGLDLKTTRISHEPYWEECDKEPPLIVTDWSLLSAKQKQANISRKFPLENNPLLKETLIKNITPIVPGSTVCASGRTSGHQRGQVCEVPAYVSGDEHGNGTGRATREWFVEEPYPYDNEDEFIRGGIGVEGDSGAAIVDCETNGLIGQLWGRNKYWGAGPRVVYFTPMADIFDDIQEKCKEQTRPQLPQYRDESDRYPVYPSCRQCYDLQSYLDSRRSSRESIQSMIGGRNDSEHDLTSNEAQSELATPQDHSYWLRYAGPDDAGSSFGGVVSPVPVNPLLVASPRTPGVADIKSPYATTLNLEDLYSDYGMAPDMPPNKRFAPPLMRSSSTEGSKRTRIS